MTPNESDPRPVNLCFDRAKGSGGSAINNTPGHSRLNQAMH